MSTPAVSTTAVSLPEGVPHLTQYYFYLTSGCNLACQHCWLSPTYQPKGTTGGHLDLALFKLAIEEGLPLGLNNVKLTGGEPLLHPDLKEIIAVLKDVNLPTTVETNATLMTPDLARTLKEAGIVAHLSVSLDGARAETHDPFRGVKGSFDKAVAGIRMLVEAGIRPQVIMSLHSGNVTEIEELAMLAQAWGAKSMKFNLVQPSGRGATMLERGQVLDIPRLVEIGKWVENDLQKRVSMDLHYSWPMIFFGMHRLLKHGQEACAIFNILGVLANGSLAMCGIGTEIPELTYGQLGVDRVAEVWTRNPMLQDIRKLLPDQLEGVCGECLFKRQCLGSCVAENYHQSQRLTAPFWFCQQADEAGLLPRQRLRSSSQAA